jgi:hypothetical protein
MHHSRFFILNILVFSREQAESCEELALTGRATRSQRPDRRPPNAPLLLGQHRSESILHRCTSEVARRRYGRLSDPLNCVHDRGGVRVLRKIEQKRVQLSVDRTHLEAL